MAFVVIANILYLARSVLFPFIISIVLAQLLHPVVVFLEERLPTRHRMPGATRIVSVFTIYVAFAAIVAGILFAAIPPLYAESQELIQASPELYDRARITVEDWSRNYVERVPVELRTEIEESVAAGSNVLADAAWDIVRRTVSGVSNAVTLVIGLAIVPFFLFYILKDREVVVGGVYPLMSERRNADARTHVMSSPWSTVS